MMITLKVRDLIFRLSSEDHVNQRLKAEDHRTCQSEVKPVADLDLIR